MVTKEQQEAIGRLVANYHNTPGPVMLTTMLGQFDLPDGYVAFTLKKEGRILYGGIAPDGAVST